MADSIFTIDPRNADMYGDSDKSFILWELLYVCGTIFDTGAGLIANEGLFSQLRFSYKVVNEIFVDFEAKWGDDGRLQYYHLDVKNEKGDGVKYEIGERTSIPGFPIETFLGMCILPIIIVMKKFKSVE